MSQAIAAPSTGEPIVTGGNSANPTEMSSGKCAAQSPSRRDLLAGAGLAMLAPVAADATASIAPDVRAAWAAVVHEYDRLKIRDDAYYALGPMDWVSTEYEFAFRTKTSDPDRFEKAFAAVRAEEDSSWRIYEPTRDAAIAVIKTPAPDLEAVRLKMTLHKDHLESTENERLAWSCIVADLERLKA